MNSEIKENAATTNNKDVRVPKSINARKLKKVFICSPFRGVGSCEGERERDQKKKLDRAREACGFAVMQNCIPYAPHLYFPQFLTDSDLDERETGIRMGLTWLACCDELWVIGRNISEGMKREIAKAKARGIPIISYVGKRTPEDRLLDAIFHPEIEYHEMHIFRNAMREIVFPIVGESDDSASEDGEENDERDEGDDRDKSDDYDGYLCRGCRKRCVIDNDRDDFYKDEEERRVYDRN